MAWCLFGPGYLQPPWWHRLVSTYQWSLLLWCFNLNPSMDHPFPNFNYVTIEVWEWISNFFTHFIMDVITCTCWDSSMSEEGAPGMSQCRALSWLLEEVCCNLGPVSILHYLYWYRDFHRKNIMVMRLSYLYSGNPYTGRLTSLYWNYI